MINTLCPYCRSTNKEQVTLAERYYLTREKFDYYRCTDCGSWRIVEPPADMAPYYKEYYSHIRNLTLPTAKQIKQLYETMLELELPRRPKVADIGGGSHSDWAYTAVKAEFDVTVIDPYADKWELCPYKIIKKDILKEQLPDKYDFIRASHVMEHVDDPTAFITMCMLMLNDGGVLELSVPLSSGRAYDVYGCHYVPALDVPRHLTVPSYQGLMHFMYRLGLLPCGVDFGDSNFPFWFSEAVQKGIAPRDIELGRVDNPFTQEQYKEWNDYADESSLMCYGSQVRILFKKV